MYAQISSLLINLSYLWTIRTENIILTSFLRSIEHVEVDLPEPEILKRNYVPLHNILLNYQP